MIVDSGRNCSVRGSAFIVFITEFLWYVKDRRIVSSAGSLLFCAYSGSRPSYMIDISPYTFPQFRIGRFHFFVASNVARYSAFKSA